jgi:diacylglycerol O-acyltransferase
MANRMQGYDALMWELEGHPLLNSGMAAVMLLDGPPDKAVLLERLEEMSATIPQLRYTVRPKPRLLAPARWSETTEVSLVDHVSWHSADGSDNALDERIADLVDQRYVGTKPMWRVQVITDLPKGQAAVLFGMHHSLSDGVGAMIMAARFFDADSEGTRLVATAPDESPKRVTSAESSDLNASVSEDLAAGASLGSRALHSLPPALRTSIRNPRRAVEQTARYLTSVSRLLAPANTPLSTLMTDRSGHAAFGLIEFPVQDLKRAAHSQGGRLNDAFLCALALGLHRYHDDVGHHPDAIRTSMPVNYRAADSSVAGGNEFTPIRLRLPLAATGAVETMAVIRERLAAGRSEPAASATPAFTEVLARLPTPATRAIVSGMFTSTDLSATNVPGPPTRLWCAGRRVEAMYAIGPRVGMGLCATLFTYAGTAYIALNLDTGAIPDAERMVDCLQAGVDEVLALGGDFEEPTPPDSRDAR